MSESSRGKSTNLGLLIGFLANWLFCRLDFDEEDFSRLVCSPGPSSMGCIRPLLCSALLCFMEGAGLRSSPV